MFNREHSTVASTLLVKDYKHGIQYKVTIIPEKRKPWMPAPFEKLTWLSEMDY